MGFRCRRFQIFGSPKESREKLEKFKNDFQTFEFNQISGAQIQNRNRISSFEVQNNELISFFNVLMCRFRIVYFFGIQI